VSGTIWFWVPKSEVGAKIWVAFQNLCWEGAKIWVVVQNLCWLLVWVPKSGGARTARPSSAFASGAVPTDNMIRLDWTMLAVTPADQNLLSNQILDSQRPI
jgi:hypothetical protein